eukprot:CAMPEP_0118966752 /NCGR_PEP_ID=MMETSP1173-20130426/4211_1 /TAXON_ID=1034831 /ORGANISM="Rhizochromulina marina cf, Strain CCMP1243" /LENGTH=60 /DNA_ID=CAMNT_0006915599 /DNA_START=95 /DNA_END=277 /DNA_ORIENTATION=+
MAQARFVGGARHLWQRVSANGHVLFGGLLDLQSQWLSTRQSSSAGVSPPIVVSTWLQSMP